MAAIQEPSASSIGPFATRDREPQRVATGALNFSFSSLSFRLHEL
jgi:hypothetical protein